MDNPPAGQPGQQPAASNGPQIRSRITVVCAECKRLKLKCDRKNPCGSCTKRDTIAKCLYSPAAAEKVDLHSLNNRLIHVESTLSQLIPSFHPTYPAVQPQQPTSSAGDNESDIRLSFVDSPQIPQPPIAPPPPTGISTLSIPTSDLNGSFLNPFGLSITSAKSESPQSCTQSLNLHLPPINIYYPPPSTPPPQSTHLFLPPPSSSSSSTRSTRKSKTASIPAPIPILPLATATDADNRTRPRITPALLSLLETQIHENTTPYITTANTILGTRWWWVDLCGRLTRFRDETEGEYPRRGGEYPPLNSRQPQLVWGGVDGWTQSHEDERERDKLGMEESLPFFAAMCAAYAIGSLLHARHNETSKSSYSDSGSGTGNYGYKLRSDLEVDVDMEDGEGRERERQRTTGTAGFLFDLSVQALGVWSGTCTGTTNTSINAIGGGGGRKDNDAPSDSDWLVARLLQVVYLLLDGALGDGASGGESGRAKVFEMVGEMVTTARRMGLGTDPDLVVGTGTTGRGEESDMDHEETEREREKEKEKDVRRSIWWDICFYDLFVSDALGQPPLVSDNAYSTRLPSHVRDEERDGEGDARYFESRCRFAHLIKTIKSRTFKTPAFASSPISPSTSMGPASYSISDAIGFETEIRQWLTMFQMDYAPANATFIPMDSDASTSSTNNASFNHLDPKMDSDTARRCDFTIIANKLIMKLYLPFFHAQDGVGMQYASFGMVNAAHAIICTCKAFVQPSSPSSSSSLLPLPSLSLSSLPFTSSSPLPLTLPIITSFYSLTETLGSAAIMCAYAVIRQPTGMWARAAMEDMSTALDLIKNGTLGVMIPGLEEAVDGMRMRAESARGLSLSPKVNSPLKRKHDEVDVAIGDRPLSAATTTTAATVDPGIMTESPPSAAVEVRSAASSKSAGKEKERDKPKSKHAKKAPPTSGIRARPTRNEDGTLTSFGRLTAPTNSRDVSSSSGAPVIPSPSQSLIETIQKQQQQQRKTQLRTSAAGYRSRSSSISITQTRDPRLQLQAGPSMECQQSFDDNQMDTAITTTRNTVVSRSQYSVTPRLELQQQPSLLPHLQLQPQPHQSYPAPSSMYAPSPSGSYDHPYELPPLPPSRRSFDSASSSHPPPISSPYTPSSAALSDGSSPYTTGAGGVQSTLSTPNFGPAQSPSAYVSAYYLDPRDGYAESEQQYEGHPRQMPSTTTNNSNNTSVPGTPLLYDKPSHVMYDIKPPPEPNVHHYNAQPQGFHPLGHGHPSDPSPVHHHHHHEQQHQPQMAPSSWSPQELEQQAVQYSHWPSTPINDYKGYQ